MTYTVNLRSAARRNLQAGESLHDTHRKDVAGYLYGIAAECALKAMMIDAGMRPAADRHKDPFFLHFPQLRTALLDTLSGRRVSPLSNFLSDQFLQYWAVEMRYCDGQEIKASWVDKWKDQATQAVNSIGT
jgi:hypothetical protein